MNDAIRMQISAFVDGELPDNEADLLLRRMGQDAELRLQVAQYMAIGRAMRGEAAVKGVDRIHERVSAAIDDKPLHKEIAEKDPQSGRAIRPLIGVAVAATVALVAIFGLQQTTGVGTEPAVPATTLAESPDDDGYTVPQPIDDQLRQYYLSHRAEHGANGVNSRFVDLRLSEEALDETPAEEDSADAEDAGRTDDAPPKP